jgi:hypothetical protein
VSYSGADEVKVSVEESSVLNVALTSIPESGHFLPIVKLGSGLSDFLFILYSFWTGLAAKGHRVKIYVYDVFVPKYEHQIKNIGGECIGLPCGFSSTAEFQASITTAPPFGYHMEVMLPALRTALKEDTPDVMIGDFVSFAAFQAAMELSIPTVCNLPGPYGFLKTFSDLADPVPCLCGTGLLMDWPHPVKILSRTACAPPIFKFFRKGCDYWFTSLILVNSFLPLEDPSLTPVMCASWGPSMLPRPSPPLPNWKIQLWTSSFLPPRPR